MSKSWGPREYLPREANPNAAVEFSNLFPDQPSPWGQGMDDLIHEAQIESPDQNSWFLGCRVERCTAGERCQILAGEHATVEIVELVANTLHPRTTSGAARRRGRYHSVLSQPSRYKPVIRQPVGELEPWTFNERTTIEHVEGGWRIVLCAG